MVLPNAPDDDAHLEHAQRINPVSGVSTEPSDVVTPEEMKAGITFDEDEETPSDSGRGV